MKSMMGRLTGEIARCVASFTAVTSCGTLGPIIAPDYDGLFSQNYSPHVGHSLISRLLGSPVPGWPVSDTPVFQELVPLRSPGCSELARNAQHVIGMLKAAS